jgi:anti-sigma regulatory factor (Ser/Thr protein kinase)
MTALMNQELLTALDRADEVQRAPIQLESEESAVRASRRFVRNQLVAWGFLETDELLYKVVLTASELVTNAVMHGRTRPPCESELVGIALVFRPGFAVGLLVTDNSAEMPVASSESPADSTSGRGLALVEAYSDSWRAIPRRTTEGVMGKDVWALFGCRDHAASLCQPA